MSTLVAAYTFNESDTHDYSGNKYHLTNSGGTFAATGSSLGYGYDAAFTASNFANTGSFTSFAAFTGLSVVFYFKAVSGSGAIIKNSAVSVSLTNTPNIQFSVTTGGTPFIITSNTTISYGTWYSVVCTWDGFKQRIFINGVLDNTTDAAFTNPDAGDLTLKIGDASSISSTVFNCIEIRNAAMTSDQAYSLSLNPGGVVFNMSNHNFATGDLIADSNVLAQAVVSWVIDVSNILIYPFTTNNAGAFFRYGNIYSSTRQYCFEICNDFDGNTNAQVSVKYPIASFSDYASPANTYTIDYRGTTFPLPDSGVTAGSYTNVNLTVGADGRITAASNGSGGSGTVSSVAVTMPAIFSVSGSPITTSGTIAVTFANQNANLVFAGPSSGSPAAPTFRALVTADLPTALQNNSTTNTQSSLDNSTKVATTAYVDSAVSASSSAGADLYLFYNY